MAFITRTNALNLIAEKLQEQTCLTGLEVSDDPFYRTRVSWTTIEETSIVALAIDFPEEVVCISGSSARAVVERFNESEETYQLTLSSCAYGSGLSYEGIADYPYQRLILFVRVWEA